jgi:hypothetical protein
MVKHVFSENILLRRIFCHRAVRVDVAAFDRNTFRLHELFNGSMLAIPRDLLEPADVVRDEMPA